MRKNKSSIASTGGGPSTYCPLTELEEQVIRLMSMEEAVNGNSAGRFGAENIVPEELAVGSEDSNTVGTSQTEEATIDVGDLERPSTSSQAASFRRRSASTSAGRDQLLKTQVDNQIDYQQKSLAKQGEICDVLKDISRNLRKSREIEEKKLKHRMQMDAEKLKMQREMLELKKIKAMTERKD